MDHQLSSARNENGFIINDGILLDYIGTDTDITIPDDVNVIMGLNAVPFGKCKYKERADWYVSAAKRITIPATVSYILDSFDYCDCVRFLPRNGNSLTIGNGCFNSLGYSEIDDPVKHFELPEGLCEAGGCCFEGVPVITLPSSLRRIGERIRLCRSNSWMKRDFQISSFLTHLMRSIPCQRLIDRSS